jgi:AraC-like DNA-binding protein
VYSELQFFPVILLLATGQGLFLAFALMLMKNGNWQANRYLGFFTLVLVFTVADFIIDSDSTSNGMIALRTIIWPRDYLFGPLIYFYIREMTLPGKYSIAPRQWLHFLPAILQIVIFWSLTVFNTALHKALLIDNGESTSPLANLVQNIYDFETISSVLHITCYLYLSFNVLNAHRKRIKLTFSYNEKISLNWLRYLLSGIIVIYLIWVFETFISDLVDLSDTFEYILVTSMITLILIMSILGLRQPIIFTEKTTSLDSTNNKNPENTNTKNDKEKYKTSSLSGDASQQLLDELQQLMIRDKPYLDSQLSLPQLALKLGISVNNLSQIINEKLEQNFFEFVNSYRVNEAKRFIKDEKRSHENILTIALDAGFNSKSSFYSAFKKHTGLTPGEYRKRG